MLVLIGKATSGKDTVKNILLKEYGFHSIITYTTRPKRKDEIDDVTYHYISKEDFLNKIENGFFAEWKKYNVNNEEWYYGSAKEDLINADDKSIVILTPDGVKDIKDNNISAKIIYLYSNLSTIKTRLKNRKDVDDKAEDRINRDLKDFKNAGELADKIVYNNLDDDINKVVEKVNKLYKEVSNNFKDNNTQSR